MNQGRIWCVVHPTVGLPLFLGSVAITSLVVHASVMTHTTWMGNYWQGKAARVAENGGTNVASADSKTLPGYSMTVTPVPPTSGSAQASFVVTLSPTATAVSPDQAQLVDPPKQTTSAVALK